MIKVTVKGQQQAQAALKKSLAKFTTKSFVTVGIHEDTGVHADSGLTNAQLGALLNFGTQTSPARPWLEPGVKSGLALYAAEIKSTVENGGDLEEALTRVGLIAEGKAKQFMIELKTPANAASTIAAKGSSNPLIDTGATVQSISSKLQITKPNEGGV